VEALLLAAGSGLQVTSMLSTSADHNFNGSWLQPQHTGEMDYGPSHPAASHTIYGPLWSSQD
jgi:hypothetical protein